VRGSNSRQPGADGCSFVASRGRPVTREPSRNRTQRWYTSIRTLPVIVRVAWGAAAFVVTIYVVLYGLLDTPVDWRPGSWAGLAGVATGTLIRELLDGVTPRNLRRVARVSRTLIADPSGQVNSVAMKRLDREVRYRRINQFFYLIIACACVVFPILTVRHTGQPLWLLAELVLLPSAVVMMLVVVNDPRRRQDALRASITEGAHRARDQRHRGTAISEASRTHARHNP
jgi:hypothetical protein